MCSLEEQGRQRLRNTCGVFVHARQPDGFCPNCKGPTKVRKTLTHGGVTLAHGEFRVRETEKVCAKGCACEDRIVAHRSPEVGRLLIPRSTAGYDLMAHVGVQRFVRHRQREEIRQDLASRWGIEISTGEVSALAVKFCVYLKALHQAHAASLREVLASDGGWPMHLDATGEDGQGTLLCIYAGWRGWVLGAWKIPTERAEAILPRIVETGELFGPPCAVMRDLGRAMIEASQKFIASLDTTGAAVDRRPVPNLGCHMHFVRDVGKDLLRDSHDALRELFRRFGIVADLRSLAREMGRKLGSELERAREQVASWLESEAHPYELPAGRDGLAAVRALVQWTLDYPADGHDEGFPFDRPWLDLHARCIKICRVVEAFLSKPQHGEGHRALWKLFNIVVLVRSQVPFGRQAAILSVRAKLLDELRGALRLDLKPGGRNALLPVVFSPEKAAMELQNIEAAVDALTSSLRERRPGRGPAQNQRAAIDLVLDHIERHGASLFGHLIALPKSLGGGIRVVERTNVILESFFHVIKRGERRRSGRKNLGQDLEHLPPEAALALNLRCPDYLQVVCGGSLDGLPAAFAKLDEGHRDRSLPARIGVVRAVDTVSSSMTTTDRRLVRTEAMTDRVEDAARSRAARLT